MSKILTTKSKILTTNKNRPCPICGKTNGNCRSFTENDLILCMTFADKYSASNHPDYRFIGITKDGRWGKYVPRNDNDFDREQWLREKESRQIERETTNQAALSIEERDKAIRSILEQLELKEGDRRYLENRGLPSHVIVNCRTVNQWQKLSHSVDPDLPGVSKYGNKLNNPTKAIIEAIPNHLNQFIALRLHNRFDKNHKYTWLSSSNRGIKPNLPNGELPAAFHNPEAVTVAEIMGLSEGMEIKAAIAATRLGFPVMGFSGHNAMAKSPQQIKECADSIGAKSVVIIPDDNVFDNAAVNRSVAESIKQVEALGLIPLVAWFGQTHKGTGDIDEISSDRLAKIEYLTPDKFWELCSNPPEKISNVNDFIKWFEKELKPKSKGLLRIEGTEFTGDRAKAWLETDGDILDASATGDGKSHDVPEIENSEGKVWYVCNDHRNPTVKKIADEFTDLFPRNQYGFYRDKQGKLVKATEDTPKEKIETTSGKCPLAGMFTHLANLGHNPNEGGSKNEICQSCPYLNTCQSAEGWYLKDRRDTLTNAHKIRCHLESMPREFDYSKDIVSYDEPSQLFKSTKDINATENQVYLDLKRVRKTLNDDQFLAIDGILQGFAPLFENRQKYGLDHHKILEALKVELPEDLDDIIEAIAAHPLGLSNIFQQPDHADLSGLTQQERQKYRGLTKAVNAVENVKALLVNENALQNIPPNTLIHILKALRDDKGIALSVAYGTLTITLNNRANYAFVNRTKKNIYLDATSSVEDLIEMTSSDRPITAIRSKVKPTNNLSVVQIKTKGIGSNQVSNKAINRGRAICQTLGEMPVIGPKSWQESLDIDGYWFNHNRGSNDFEGLPNLLVLGLPRPNLGMIKAEYYALKGTLDGFEEYYQRRINQEIVQVVGRPRANRYPDQQFTIYFVTPENTDLSWLSDFGCKVTVKSAFEITPEAGTETQCIRLQIVNAVQSLLSQGANVTQKAIAKIVGMTQQGVSKTLKQSRLTLFCIVEKLTKILLNGHTTGPFKDSLSSSCMTAQLYEDFRAFFDLPIEAIAQDAITTIETYGLDYFWEYLSNFPKALQGKYLVALQFIITNDEDLAQLNPSQ